jgi:hypothetical protein
MIPLQEINEFLSKNGWIIPVIIAVILLLSVLGIILFNHISSYKK